MLESEAKTKLFECAAQRQGTAGGNDGVDCQYPECQCDFTIPILAPDLCKRLQEIDREMKALKTHPLVAAPCPTKYSIWAAGRYLESEREAIMAKLGGSVSEAADD